MSAEDLLKIIEGHLSGVKMDNMEIFKIPLMNSTLYDPNRLDKKVSLAIMEETKDGLRKRFQITVEDMVGLVDV
mgnify:CR=1 FL=1